MLLKECTCVCVCVFVYLLKYFIVYEIFKQKPSYKPKTYQILRLESLSKPILGDNNSVFMLYNTTRSS